MVSMHLTDLEGAVLTEVGHRSNHTAFRVRRAFEQSGSANWRGSAGAVYAAVKRLVDRDLLKSRPIGGKRGGNTLELSEKGRNALFEWLTDVTRAADVGSDPFRLRAGLWLQLPRAARNLLVPRLSKAIDEEICRLKSYSIGQDDVERIEIELALELQSLRKRWLKRLDEL